jgi:DNA-binding beta-propeller fold protein YncE
MYSATRVALAAVIAMLTLGTYCMHSQTPPARAQVGPEPDGGFLLNTGWQIHPAGKTIPLSTLPMSLAPSPDGQKIAVLNGGFLPASVDYLDMKTATKTSSVSITDAWRGLAFSADGARLYAGNGARARITEFGVHASQLTISKKFALFPGEPPQTLHLIADILPFKNRLLVLDTLQNRLLEVDPMLGKVTAAVAVAPYPYSMVMAPDGNSVYISSWTTASVVQYTLSSGKELARISVGAHPTEMVWLSHGRLAVACANTNYVFVLAKDQQGKWHPREKLNLAFTPRQPVGMTPSSLSLTRNGQTLYIACSDAADNDQPVGVMVEGLSKSRFWGSTAMFVLEDDAQDGATM